MKVTFPHMGNMYIPLKVLLDTTKIEYIVPPASSSQTIKKGIENSPEFACLPFKTILGDLIYGIEHGAEFIIFGGGDGQCRFGYFGDLLHEILKSLNHKINFVCLNTSNITFKDVITKIKPLTKGISVYKIAKGIILSAKTVFMVDKLDELARRTRCREIRKGSTDKIMSSFHKKAMSSKGYKNIRKIINDTSKELKKLALDKSCSPIKICIVGEIYVGAHPNINLELERKLGNMGVYVKNTLSVSHWIKEHFIKSLLPVKSKNKAVLAGQEFIHTQDIGGHGIHSVGYSILSSRKGFDGVVHIYPFTCLPEIIAQSAFCEVQNKYDIPIITLIVDEMTGEAGYMTRLEAFIDMIRMRKAQRKSPVFCKELSEG